MQDNSKNNENHDASASPAEPVPTVSESEVPGPQPGITSVFDYVPESWKKFCDLRDRQKQPEYTRECHECFAHPVTVVLIGALAIFLVCFSVFDMIRYLWSKSKSSLTRLWYQTSVSITFITILAMMIPYRFRFGYNMYGLITILLFLQYGILILAFPMPSVDKDDIAFLQEVKRQAGSLKK